MLFSERYFVESTRCEEEESYRLTHLTLHNMEVYGGHSRYLFGYSVVIKWSYVVLFGYSVVLKWSYVVLFGYSVVLEWFLSGTLSSSVDRRVTYGPSLPLPPLARFRGTPDSECLPGVPAGCAQLRSFGVQRGPVGGTL